jgi:hypothetical protein
MFTSCLKSQYKYLAYAFLVLSVFVLSSCIKQSGQTLLLNIPYSEARKVILENGWKPAKIKRDTYGMYSISHYLDLGYTEVDACSGTGKGYCRFVFQNDLGLFMEVTTQEAPFAPKKVGNEDWDGAVVIYYGITDKID